MTVEPPTGDLLTVTALATAFTTPRGAVRAVDDVSLRLGHGESVGIVGESGSGKSVLVRSIMNLLPRSGRVHRSGTALFEGRDVRALRGAAARHFWGPEIAMVFQDPMTSLNPVRTIGRQITDPIRFHLGLNRAAATARAAELLTLVGISDPTRRLGQYPHELSGGMRQRVMLAIALSCEPKLLIADEPTTALDVTVQKEILDLLAQLRAQSRMSMILISHDLTVVAGRTDRTIVMYGGRIAEEGDTRILFARTRHPYTAALLRSVPRIEEPSHTPLEVIAGSAPDLVHPPPGCGFAPRCRQAQPRCVAERPPLRGDADQPGHRYACFFPYGTPAGRQALDANQAAGRTASGLDLSALAAGRDIEPTDAVAPVGAAMAEAR